MTKYVQEQPQPEPQYEPVAVEYVNYHDPRPVPVHEAIKTDNDNHFRPSFHEQKYADQFGSPANHVSDHHHPYGSNQNHQLPPLIIEKKPSSSIADSTPHPLVFGFKPVASFVTSTLEGVFGSKKPQRPVHHRGPFKLPPAPRPVKLRQPKFYHRQPYQQSKPIRFPLGFFY